MANQCFMAGLACALKLSTFDQTVYVKHNGFTLTIMRGRSFAGFESPSTKLLYG